MQSVSPYRYYGEKVCVTMRPLIERGIIEAYTTAKGGVASYKWEHWVKAARKSGHFTQNGGRNREPLLEFVAVPEPYRTRITEAFGQPGEASNPFEGFFKMDVDARRFFTLHRFPNGDTLSDEQIDRYTMNASVLNGIPAFYTHRCTLRQKANHNTRGVWNSVVEDVLAFSDVLQKRYGMGHTVKRTRLHRKLETYGNKNYSILIDGRNQNTAALKTTAEMLSLWSAIFARVQHKPNYAEVAEYYDRFRRGELEVYNRETGELYDPAAPCFVDIDESTVRNWLSEWATKAPAHSLRSGDRQKFKSLYEPWHKLEQPKFAGSIISVDDRQPPFSYGDNKRVWFYNGIDLGSEAFTAWVYGTSKEGIITDFYRQLVRNYTAWDICLPYELEGELSLNASFTDGLLKPGSMFSEVRIEANNARGKRIEGFYRPLRYKLEKRREGWLARPHALSESNQPSAKKVPELPYDTIVENALRDLETWNNMPHSNQELHPGMTRWDVFMDKQHPALQPTNWRGILPYIGYPTSTSMNAGRIILQGKHRVVGIGGEVALGDDLLNIMRRIEGRDVMVYWLDGNDGQVMKALVYDSEGDYVCELLGDLSYQKAKLEQTDDDRRNRELMSAYANTVQSYIRRTAQSIEHLELIERPVATASQRFRMDGLTRYTPRTERTAKPVEEEMQEVAAEAYDRGSRRLSFDNF